MKKMFLSAAHRASPWSFVLTAFAALTVPAPMAWAGETIDWNDGDPLDMVDGVSNSLAPSGSGGVLAASRSNSLSDNDIAVISGMIFGNVFGAIDSTLAAGAVTNNEVAVRAGATVNGLVYGGYSTEGAATGNSVTVHGHVKNTLYGGYSHNGAAIGNTVILGDGAIADQYVYGGYSYDIGDVIGNSVTGSGVTVGSSIYGGDNWKGEVINNSVALDGVSIIGAYVFGGYSSNGDVKDNKVTLGAGVTVKEQVFGAASDGLGDVLNNSVTASGVTVIRDVYGGHNWNGAVTGNKTTITVSQVGGGVYGGFSHDGNVNDNSVILDGSAVTGAVMGGSNDRGDANNNNVLISGGTVGMGVYGGNSLGIGVALGNSVAIRAAAQVSNGNVYGGFSVGGEASNNTASVSDSFVMNGAVYGGFSSGANANNNQVFINDAHVGAVSGGHSAGVGFANNNKITISGASQIDGNVIGGHGDNNGAINNIVTLNGGRIGGDLYGGQNNGFSSDNVFTGNALNVNAFDLFVGGSVGNFQSLNFFLPSYAGPGAVMLDVAGGGDLTDGAGVSSVVTMGIASGGSALRVGDSVRLIHTASGLTSTPDLNRTASATQGFSLNYTFDIWTDPTTLWATVLTAPVVNPQTKALSEGRMAGLALVNQGADLVERQGVKAAMIAADAQHWATFGALSGGSSRYDIGSHIDMDALSIMAGISGRPDLDDNALLLGAFLEAGWGHYDSCNSFRNAASVTGDGDSRYYGAGLLARYDVTAGPFAGLYGDGSLRAGRAKTDFSSNDLIAADGRRASYESSAAYWGAQAALGAVFALTERTSLDLSTAYLWTHQNSDRVAAANDPIYFDAVTSQRWRNGGQLRYESQSASGSVWTPYVGLYHDYEFNGDANATTYGYAIEIPSLKGSTGIGETGFGFKPAADSALSLDLGVQGYVGVREGVAGRLLAKLAL